jgi:hypothetical protein
MAQRTNGASCRGFRGWRTTEGTVVQLRSLVEPGKSLARAISLPRRGKAAPCLQFLPFMVQLQVQA